MSENAPRGRARGSAHGGTLDRTLESWNPITVVAVALAGAAACILLLLYDADSTADSKRFVGSSGFDVWAAVLAAQTAVWAVVTVPLWREVITVYRTTNPSRWIWGVPGVITVALATLATFSGAGDVSWPLVGHHQKVWILTAVAAAGVGIPALFGIAVVQDQVRRHDPGEVSTRHVALVLSARAQIKRFLGVAGAVIGLAVLASGALQRATVPDFLDADVFPPSSVLLYGAFFSGLLVLVYVPAHLSLRRLCVDIIEQFYPVVSMPAPTSEEFAPWLDGRARLETLVQVNASTLQQLQSSVFVLAPLLSALLAAMVPPL